MSAESIEEKVTRILLEYALTAPAARPLPASLSLRLDLEVDSLSLVSVAIRIGEEYGIDLVERGADLGGLETVGDLVTFARTLDVAA